MAMMASKAEVEAAVAGADVDGGEAVTRSVTDVEVRRSVADGVDVLAEVLDWI